MKLEAKKYGYVTVEVGFPYPFYRREGISEDERIYYKFENESKIMIIHECMISTKITTYDDPNVSRDILTEDIINGCGRYDIIEEKIFNMAEDRLISKIQRG